MENIQTNLYNTLVYQDRYQYVLEGLKNTIIMAIFPTFIGIILGIIIAIIKDNYEKNERFKILNFICNSYVNVI